MEQVSNPEMRELFTILREKGLSIKPSTYREHLYDMVVKNKEGIVRVKHFGLSASQMGKWRKEYRSYGYNVSTYEQSNLTGEVKPVEFVPPTRHRCTGSGMEYQKPLRRTARQVMLDRRLQKARQNILIRVNNRTNKEHEHNENILVYEKVGNVLRLSTSDIELAARYVLDMLDTNTWGENDWIMYVPQKVYERLAA